MKICKKSMAIFLAILMLLSVLTVAATAASRYSDYYVAGVEELCGSSWDSSDNDNLMADDDDDGVHTITYLDVAQGEYLFKVTDGYYWWGNSETGGNMKFKVTDTCPVTISFDTETEQISVTGDNVITDYEMEIKYLTLVGDSAICNGNNWEPNAESCKMTEIKQNVYQITVYDVAVGYGYCKFAANGSWDDNWGEGAQLYADELYYTDEYTAVYAEDELGYDGGNIYVNVEKKCDIRYTVDMTKMDFVTGKGATYKIEFLYGDEESTQEPTEEPTTMEEPTEEPTTEGYDYTEEPTTEGYESTEEPTTEGYEYPTEGSEETYDYCAFVDPKDYSGKVWGAWTWNKGGKESKYYKGDVEEDGTVYFSNLGDQVVFLTTTDGNAPDEDWTNVDIRTADLTVKDFGTYSITGEKEGYDAFSNPVTLYTGEWDGEETESYNNYAFLESEDYLNDGTWYAQTWNNGEFRFVKGNNYTSYIYFDGLGDNVVFLTTDDGEEPDGKWTNVIAKTGDLKVYNADTFIITGKDTESEKDLYIGDWDENGAKDTYEKNVYVDTAGLGDGTWGAWTWNDGDGHYIEITDFENGVAYFEYCIGKNVIFLTTSDGEAPNEGWTNVTAKTADLVAKDDGTFIVTGTTSAVDPKSEEPYTQYTGAWKEDEATEATVATEDATTATEEQNKITPGFYVVGSEEACGAEWGWDKPYEYSTPMQLAKDGTYFKIVENVKSSYGNITDEGDDLYVFKVVYVDEEGNITWHPGGTDNNTQIKVEEDNSTLVFRFELLASEPTVEGEDPEAVKVSVYGPEDEVPVIEPATEEATTVTTEETVKPTESDSKYYYFYYRPSDDQEDDRCSYVLFIKPEDGEAQEFDFEFTTLADEGEDPIYAAKVPKTIGDKIKELKFEIFDEEDEWISEFKFDDVNLSDFTNKVLGSDGKFEEESMTEPVETTEAPTKPYRPTTPYRPTSPVVRPTSSVTPTEATTTATSDTSATEPNETNANPTSGQPSTSNVSPTAEPTAAPTNAPSEAPTNTPIEAPTEAAPTEKAQPTTEQVQPTAATQYVPATEKVEKSKDTNPVKVTVSKKTIKKSKLNKNKKASRTVKPLTIKDAKGAVKVVKVKKGSAPKIYKKITVDAKTGAITFKKGSKYKKGTYTIKLKITVKGNNDYKPKTINKKVKIVIK